MRFKGYHETSYIFYNNTPSHKPKELQHHIIRRSQQYAYFWFGLIMHGMNIKLQHQFHQGQSLRSHNKNLIMNPPYFKIVYLIPQMNVIIQTISEMQDGKDDNRSGGGLTSSKFRDLPTTGI
jgi:hypothetical protein